MAQIVVQQRLVVVVGRIAARVGVVDRVLVAGAIVGILAVDHVLSSLAIDPRDCGHRGWEKNGWSCR